MNNLDPAKTPIAKPGSLMVRLVAALVMIPPVLASIYFGYPVFNIFVAVMVALMAWEWGALVCRDGGGSATTIILILFLAGSVLAASLGQYIVAMALVVAVAALSASKALLPAGAGRVNGSADALWMAFGAFYIGLPALALLWLRGDGEGGRDTIYWLFVLVWAADTGAYAAGRLIGGAKLAPSISPSKTWAGLAGCVFSAALVGAAVAYLARSGDYLMLAAVSAVVGLVSQGGDLIESAIKRHFGVKDSGRLIPGHGGILDRVDALLAAILIAALIKLAYGDSIVRWL